MGPGSAPQAALRAAGWLGRDDTIQIYSELIPSRSLALRSERNLVVHVAAAAAAAAAATRR